MLACPDYIIWKGFNTAIDMQRIKIGLEWNMYVTLFYPLKILNLHKNETNYKTSHEKNAFDLKTINQDLTIE